MPPKRPLRPKRQQPAEASAPRGPLGSFCVASKSLLDTVDSGKRSYDSRDVEAIASQLEDLEPTAGALDHAGRSALLIALLQCISAALRWPAPRTADEMDAEEVAKGLCESATYCVKDLVSYDMLGAFLQSRQHRDEAVTFASALLKSDALNSFAQRLAEASAGALDELLPYQRNQQGQQHEDRPMGHQQQGQRHEAATGAAAAVDGGEREQHEATSSTSSGERSPSLQRLELARTRIEPWLSILDELGTLVHIIARHDPYAPTAGYRPTTTIFNFTAQAPARPLEPGRPPPIHALFAGAVTTSGILEHAARAMAAMALLCGTVEQHGSSQAAGGDGGVIGGGGGGGGSSGGSGGGSGSGGGTSSSAYSIWIIETCASLMQLVGLAQERADETPVASKGSSGSQPSGGGSSRSSTAQMNTRPAGPTSAPHGDALQASQQLNLPSPFGPWSRHVLTCLGLRCLHALDGGSCYGMPRELVAGLPHMVAPGTFRCDKETGEVRRTALTPVQEAVSCIQVLGPMVRFLEPVERHDGGALGRTARMYGGEARGTKVYGGSGTAGAVGVRAPTGSAQGGEVDGGGREVRWPCVGPKAARDISRRVVGWAMGVARGWVAEEEQVRSAGSAGASSGGGIPWATLGVMGAVYQRGGGSDTTPLAKGTLAPLTLRALRLYHSTLGEAGAGAAAAAAALGGSEGGVASAGGHGQQRQRGGEGREQQQQQHLGVEEQEQEQQALLAEWYGLACSVASYAMHWPTGDEVGCDLAQLMGLGLPQLTQRGRLPTLPPPRLAAALAGGYLPCLERLLRRCGRRFAYGDVAMSLHLIIHNAGLKGVSEFRRDPDILGVDGRGGGSGIVNLYSHDLPWLLAYGKARQSASLLASMAKVVRRAARGDSAGVTQGCGGGSSSSTALGAAAPDAESVEVVVDGVASMLCRSLGAAFAWMQQLAGGYAFDRSARAATVTPAAAGAGVVEGGGTAACPAGAARLRLLLSFALARVVPSLSAHCIRQGRQLPMPTGGRVVSTTSGGSTAAEAGVELAKHMVGDLENLLGVLLVVQKAVWRCRDLVSKVDEAGSGPGSGGRSSGGRGASAAGGRGRAGAGELGALADGLQGLLDGEADMAGLVGAALDCLQLLPASDGGKLAAKVLELTHSSLFTCAMDLVSRGPPAAYMTWETLSPAYRQLVSAGPGKLRAAVSAARAGGYCAAVKAGETLLQIMTASLPGAVVHPTPEVPIWLLSPGEVGQELGGSCCCNARCTRLEGDSEAGEGQGRGLLVCGRCRGAWYCCRECQAADWAAGHKRTCRGK